MEKMMLYFGSFNPVHRGHIAMAEYAVKQGLCDRLALVVSPRNPLKDASELAGEADRFTMAELACRNSAYPERIVPSGIEFVLPRPSYTIDTLDYLRRNHPQYDYSVLMGSDLLPQLVRWKEYRRILDEYPVWVYPREKRFENPYPGQVSILEGAPVMEVSSTAIRETLTNGRECREWLDREVAAYIKEKGLWTCATK